MTDALGSYNGASTGGGSLGTFPGANGSVPDPNEAAFQSILGSSIGPQNAGRAILALNSASPEQIFSLQESLIGMGLLAAKYQPTGSTDSVTRDAWQRLVTQLVTVNAHQPQSTGVTPKVLLDAGANGESLEKSIATLQTSIQAPISKSISTTDPNVLRDNIEQAWEDALGFAPTQAQLSGMVAKISGSEVAAQTSDIAAQRAGEMSALTYDKGQMTALQQLGDNGLDGFLSAYKSTVASTFATGPQGALLGKDPGPMPITPSNPAGTPGVPVYGGFYALSAPAWQAGLKALGYKTAQYPTAGAAPEHVQDAVASFVANSLYAKYGNWADVASEMAGGQPAAAGGKTPLTTKGTTLQSFANQVVIGVNQTLAQSLSATQAVGPTTIINRTTPNAAADTEAAARTSDPSQYFVNQASDYMGMISHAIWGASAEQMQTKQQTAASGLGEA